MKIIFHFFCISILVFLASCSTYIVSNKDIKYIEKTSITSPLNGRYDVSKIKISLFEEIKKTHIKDSSKKYTQIEVLSENILKLILISDSIIIDSIYIKGNLKDSSFRLNTKRKIESFFPIFWFYSISENYLKIDSNESLTLSSWGKGAAVFIIVPIMPGSGDFSYRFKKIK